MNNKKLSLGKLPSFSHKIKKQGISAVVATVLIILITVAAVTIIWAAIIPMIQDQIGGSTECFDASAALSVTTAYSCVNHVEDNCNVVTCGTDDDEDCITEVLCVAETGVWTNSSVSVQVHRGTGNFVLRDVEVYLGSEGSTTSHSVVDELSDVVPDVNGDKVYTIPYTGAKITEAGVAAIVEAGATVKTCDKSGMVPIPECAD